MNKKLISFFIAISLVTSQLVALAQEDVALISTEQTNVSEVVDAAVQQEEQQTTQETSKEVLASESFDTNLDDWDTVSGSGYSLKDGALMFKNKKTSETTSILLSKKIDVSNCDIQFDLKFESGIYFGPVLRAKDARSFYSLRFYKNSGKVKLLKKVKGGAFTEIKSADARIKSDDFSKVGIRLIEDTIMVSVDGNVVMEAKDSSLTMGAIGFDGYNAQAVVDNIETFKYSSINYTPSADKEDVVVSDDLKEIYVAATGNGGGDGSKEKPYVGIKKAVQAAKQAKRGNCPVNIIFKEGTYEFTESILLTNEDSGADGAPIRYMAEEGAEVVFTGAKQLNASKFKPVTGKMKNRLHSAAKDNVVMMKFSASEIPDNLKNFAQRNWTNEQRGIILLEPHIYVNDEVHTLAKWPNSDYETVLEAVSGDKVSGGGGDPNKGGSIIFSNTEPTNWLSAEQPFIQGHLGVFYHSEAVPVKNIDLSENKINLKYYTTYGIEKDHRWQIVNLIEELDIPGEYYIDAEESVLYMYPTEPLTEDTTVEIAALQTPMFILDGAKNISFEGIELEKVSCRVNTGGWYLSEDSIGHGILMKNGCENITVKGCEIHEIGGNGIYVKKGSDITIEDCFIYDTGHSGIVMDLVGDRHTLTPSNCVIRNNVLSNASVQSENNRVACIELCEGAVDVQIHNNLFYKTKNSAIRYMGNGNQMYRNEFSSVCTQAADAGTIYSGRAVLEWGNKIYENYFHDIGMKVNKGAHDSWAMFWDDELSGQEFSRNIVVANNFKKAGGLHMSGWDHVVKSNTFVNSDRAYVYSQRTTSKFDWLDRFRTRFTTGWDNGTYKVTSEAYAEKYPLMTKQLERTLEWDFPHLNSVVSNNLDVNCLEIIVLQDAYDYGTIENNVTIKEDLSKEIFVDPDNHDFRVKDEAIEKYNIPEGIIGEEFNLDDIGLQNDFQFKEEHKSFRLVAPQNGKTDIQTKDVCLTWTDAPAAESYRYQIATDPEFKEIIQEGEDIFNSVYPEGLANGMTYYWRVFAVNRSRELGFEQEAQSGVFSFTTAAQDTLYTKLLEDKIEQAEQLVNSIKEGTKAGEYSQGTKDAIRVQIKEAEDFIETGKGTQKDVEQVVYDLNMTIQGVDQYRNVGYETLGIGKREIVAGYGAPVMENKGESVVLDIEQGKSAQYMLDEVLSNYNAITFRAKPTQPMDESNSSSWLAFGLRGETASLPCYSQDMYYVLVKGSIFELQKKGVVYQTAPNNGKFKADQWNDIVFAAITTSKGIHMYFELNGEVIFDYLDTTTPNYNPGMFGIFTSKIGIEIADATSVPTTLFQRSEEIQAQLEGGATALGVDTNYYSETGTWKKHPSLAGYKGKDVRISDSASATAKWEMVGQKTHNGKVYKVSYYHVPSSDGDKNVKVKLETYMGRYETTIDMSSGAAGWVELGTFKFIGVDAMPRCNITFTPSGEGVANINAVKFELTEDGEDMLK